MDQKLFFVDVVKDSITLKCVPVLDPDFTELVSRGFFPKPQTIYSVCTMMSCQFNQAWWQGLYNRVFFFGGVTETEKNKSIFTSFFGTEYHPIDFLNSETPIIVSQFFRTMQVTQYGNLDLYQQRLKMVKIDESFFDEYRVISSCGYDGEEVICKESDICKPDGFDIFNTRLEGVYYTYAKLPFSPQINLKAPANGVLKFWKSIILKEYNNYFGHTATILFGDGYSILKNFLRKRRKEINFEEYSFVK
jgi:hypothetical protein